MTAAPAPRAASRAAPRKRGAAEQVSRQANRAARGILGLAGERMSKVDTAWLRMDSPSNLMMILGVWTIEPGITLAALRGRIEERLLKYPRFRQRVIEDAAGASWAPDPAFDLTRHVVAEAWPKSSARLHEAALQARVGELAMTPLDRKHPLWQFHLIEDHAGRSALIARIHHCIADGIALISVTMSLVDGGLPPPERKRSRRAAGESARPEDWIAESLIKPLTELTVRALGAAGDGAARSFGAIRQPGENLQRGMTGSAGIAKMGFQLASDAAALALMPDDSPTRLKGLPGRTKRVAWCAPIPLTEVRAVGKALNCSINDVLLSCVAGALGGYLRAKGDDTTGQEIRAMIPVNLRPIEDAHRLGNRFGLVPLVLPIGVDNPVERVYEVRRRMNALKGSTQPVLAFGMLAIAGLLIKPAQDALLGLFSRKTTAVMTNVPGPKDKMKILGSTLEQCMFWVPQSGDIGLGVSILSYGGGVQFGVVTDAKLVPDPQAIIDEFEPEFARLSLVTLMLPWGET